MSFCLSFETWSFAVNGGLCGTRLALNYNSYEFQVTYRAVAKSSNLMVYKQMLLQIPAVYWWYKTPSHAAELTAGYYNPSNRDGYSRVFEVLKKHTVTMKFVCPGSNVHFQENNESLADPEALCWQVIIYYMILRLLYFFGRKLTNRPMNDAFKCMWWSAF